MSLFRRVFSLILVLALLSSVSLSAMAASFEAADAAQMEAAFDYSGEDSQVNINVTANIDMNGGNLTAQEGKTYNISTKNDSTLNEVKINGSGTVNIGTDITGKDRAALSVYGDATVTVTGDITSQYDGVHAGNNSNGISLCKVNRNILRLNSKRLHFSFRQRNRLTSGSHKTCHTSGVADNIPCVVIHDHIDQDISREHFLLNGLSGAVFQFHYILHRNLNLKNLIL